MYSAYGFSAMILLIAITGVPGRQNNRNRKSQPLPWYPPLKETQVKSDDSYYSPIRINVKEEPPSKRNTQTKHRYLRAHSDENEESSILSLFRKDAKSQDSGYEKDSNKNLDKRDSRYKISKNPDDDDPDLSFFKKSSRSQNMKNSENEDSDINFLQKDSRHQIMKASDVEDPDQNYSKTVSRRQVVSHQDDDYPTSDDNVKDSGRRNSPNSDSKFYDDDYDNSEKDDKVQYEATSVDDSNYEDPEEDDMPIAPPQIETKVKRDELTPVAYNQIAEAMDQELKDMLGSNASNPCKDCGAIKMENDQLKSQIQNETIRDLLPAYACDRWFHGNRTCWLDRSIGDTVTFVLSFGEGPRNAQVQWRQEFHLLNTNKRRIFNIDSERPMWNLVIGSRGHELRISPITETDIDFNSFSAIILSAETQRMSILKHHKVNFRLKLIPIDQGFVYPGETIMLNMRRLSLPQESIRFKWFMEKDGEKSTLPSNMKLSPGGELLVVSELRQEQTGIIACSLFTNLGFFATKQRYMLNVSSSMHNVLLFNPTTTSTAEPEKRKKRSLEEEDNIEQALINLESRRKQNQQQDPNSANTPNKDGHAEPIRFRYPQVDDSRIQLLNNLRSNNPDNEYGNPRISRNVQFGRNPPMRSRQVGVMENDEIDDSNRNTNKIENIVLEVERRPETVDARADDSIAKLISSCTSDQQCAPNAVCVPGSGFCRCTLGFQGNGIFCWAEAQMRSSGMAEMEGMQMQNGPQRNPMANDY